MNMNTDAPIDEEEIRRMVRNSLIVHVILFVFLCVLVLLVAPIFGEMFSDF